jgi:hypothetical protein
VIFSLMVRRGTAEEEPNCDTKPTFARNQSIQLDTGAPFTDTLPPCMPNERRRLSSSSNVDLPAQKGIHKCEPDEYTCEPGTRVLSLLLLLLCCC